MKHIRALSKAQTYYARESTGSVLSMIFNFVLDILYVTGKDKAPRRDEGKENF